MEHCPWRKPGKQDGGVNIHKALKFWDCGDGHVIQRLLRLVGLPSNQTPRGRLINPHRTDRGSIAVHTKVRKWAMCCQNQLGSDATDCLDLFIETHREYDWRIIRPMPFERLFELVASCEYYIGIPSGIMHLATALMKKCIVIIGTITPELFMLPVRRGSYFPQAAWLYPQNVHLHELQSTVEEMNVNSDNIAMAIQGQLQCGWKNIG